MALCHRPLSALESRPLLDLHLDLDLPSTGRRRGLEAALRAAITEGRLGPGARLPSSRALARELGFARATVVAAYDQLIAEGHLVAERGSGTRVAAREAAAAPEGLRPAAVRPAYQADFRPGEPDLGSFPRRAWSAALRAVLTGAGDELLGYGDWRGRPELRRALAAYLARARAVRAEPDQVLVVSGFGHGLTSVAAALSDLGARAIAMEEPCLPPHRELVGRSGVDVVSVPVDGEGMRVADLAASRAAGAVVAAAHQYPLGATLSAARRRALVDWAREVGAWVVEDDYDGEFRYDRRPVGALQGLAPDRVVYAGSASKSLAPGTALGWLVAPPALVEPIARRLRWSMAASTIEQAALARVIDSGALDAHLRRVRGLYRRRRDAVVALLRSHAPDVEVAGVAAGLHVTVEVADREVERELVTRAASRSVGLLPLSAHYVSADVRHGVVVGYSRPPAHAFERALALLGDVLADAAGSGLLAPPPRREATP